MRIEEVPQDKGYLVKGRISDVNYALDKDGNYTSAQSQGWKPKNEALNLAWSLVHEKAEAARQGVLEGTLSPLAFYMELNIMDVHILSDYTGLSGWRIRKHLKMKHFRKIKPETLAKYAGILDLSVEQLVNIDVIKAIKLKYED